MRLRYLLSHKGLFFSLLAVALIVLLAVLTSLTGGRASPIANVLGVVSKPFQTAFTGLADGWTSWHGSVYQYDLLEAENEKLRKQIAEMEAAVRDSEAAIEENERLRRLLGLSERHRDFVYESALVTARNPSNWASSFTIDKGAEDGIQVKNSVINEEGCLVGLVTEVGSNWCTITTLIDTDMEVGAYAFRANESGVAEGEFDLMRQNVLRLSYLQKETNLKSGDLILTSGIGGVYPRDLVIGTVQGVYTEETGLSAFALIQPSVDLTRLKQVFVIKSFDISN